jgi:hypothetical protein
VGICEQPAGEKYALKTTPMHCKSRNGVPDFTLTMLARDVNLCLLLLLGGDGEQVVEIENANKERFRVTARDVVMRLSWLCLHPSSDSVLLAPKWTLRNSERI